MTTALELVFKYRQLVGAADAGAGMSLDDIEVVSTIESLFAVDAPDSGTRRWRDRPLLGTERVTVSAYLRGHRVGDRVTIVALGPEGFVCEGAPYVEEGDTLEVIVDDPELNHSYRFMARVIWAEDSGDALEVEMRFTGVPVLVRYGEHATRIVENASPAPGSSPKLPAVVVDSTAGLGVAA